MSYIRNHAWVITRCTTIQGDVGVDHSKLLTQRQLHTFFFWLKIWPTRSTETERRTWPALINWLTTSEIVPYRIVPRTNWGERKHTSEREKVTAGTDWTEPHPDDDRESFHSRQADLLYSAPCHSVEQTDGVIMIFPQLILSFRCIGEKEKSYTAALPACVDWCGCSTVLLMLSVSPLVDLYSIMLNLGRGVHFQVHYSLAVRLSCLL